MENVLNRAFLFGGRVRLSLLAWPQKKGGVGGGGGRGWAGAEWYVSGSLIYLAQ